MLGSGLLQVRKKQLITIPALRRVVDMYTINCNEGIGTSLYGYYSPCLS